MRHPRKVKLPAVVKTHTDSSKPMIGVEINRQNHSLHAPHICYPLAVVTRHFCQFWFANRESIVSPRS